MSNLARRISVLLDENLNGLTTAQLVEKTNNTSDAVLKAVYEVPAIRREPVLTALFRKMAHE